MPPRRPSAFGHLGHDDDDVGDRAVRRPQLEPVELVAALDRLGGGAEPGGVGADVGLGQQERGDVVAADEREPLALLLLGPEQHQRLGDADRLVRGEQRRDRRVPDAGQRQRAVVVDLREAEPAVLLRHLHAERAERLEPVEHGVGDLRVALDLERVDLRLEEGAEPVQERLAPLDGGGVEPRLRRDQVEPEVAEEQLLAEARELPFALARRLRDLACLAFGDLCGHGVNGTRARNRARRGRNGS